MLKQIDELLEMVSKQKDYWKELREEGVELSAEDAAKVESEYEILKGCIDRVEKGWEEVEIETAKSRKMAHALSKESGNDLYVTHPGLKEMFGL